ncbi:hypothetical protein TSAR_002889 [Trichomalopsis sarcophagae]|uniref:Uncharacterized protein n=1 Tax=Trichomalopsis sarcophagae TaxID=543379 RepID=A0A232EG27_9HYME|nr:hypothetical protein TSAR_002889 [Trichomalopsis sarcophagae]
MRKTHVLSNAAKSVSKKQLRTGKARMRLSRWRDPPQLTKEDYVSAHLSRVDDDEPDIPIRGFFGGVYPGTAEIDWDNWSLTRHQEDDDQTPEPNEDERRRGKERQREEERRRQEEIKQREREAREQEEEEQRARKEEQQLREACDDEKPKKSKPNELLPRQRKGRERARKRSVFTERSSEHETKLHPRPLTMSRWKQIRQHPLYPRRTT